MRHASTSMRTAAVAVTAWLVAAGSPAGAAIGARCWAPPVPAPVVEGFDAPACPWCAGHRGLEFAPTAGVTVRAVAAGTVAFAGSVAGLRYVAVEQPDGLRVTYGWLRSIGVVAGQRVAAGAPVGVAGDALMFTVRRDGAYLDPTPLVGRTVRRPWLVPQAAVARAAPPARLVCGR